MVNYLIRMSYDGSKYYGFQRLKKHPSVQLELEKAISKVFKTDVVVKGAGRTDKNVHALDQCASFNAPFMIEPKLLKKAINRLLSSYVRINDVAIVPDSFHARFSVKKKIYEYKIINSEINPLLYDYYCFYNYPLSIKKLKKCSKVFIGTNDYKNFVSGEVPNTISTIHKIKIFKRKNQIIIRIVGTKFYKYMVRNIVGAMLDYNKSKVTLKMIENMLNNTKKHTQLSTASPNGLYLTKIYY